jgi:transcriptional regulator with XRE-family HTH domain
METFGSRVRCARDAKGWTQEDLAREARLYSGVVVSRWERGHSRPHDPDVIVKTAEALGVSIDWLLRGIGEAPTTKTPEDASLPARIAAVSELDAEAARAADDAHLDEVERDAAADIERNATEPTTHPHRAA